MPGISRRAAIRVGAATAAGTYVAPKILWAGHVGAQQISGPPINLYVTSGIFQSPFTVQQRAAIHTIVDTVISANGGVIGGTEGELATFHGDEESLIETIRQQLTDALRAAGLFFGDDVFPQ